jgi:formylglycine-generating enzyme required for sulfatase activity
MVEVWVPGGAFQMGTTDDEAEAALQLCNDLVGNCSPTWFDDEQPAHTVLVDDFWMDKTEVTNAHFAAFLNAQGNQTEEGATWLDLWDAESLIALSGDAYRAEAGYEAHPVVEVTWYGARAYCEWIGGRLPTEAEWEYAARGPDGTIYPWGDVWVQNVANCAQDVCRDGYGTTAPVGSFPTGESWAGALDLAGNVWEWVADWYGLEYYAASPRDNPTGPASGEVRVLRGGSWYLDARRIRGAYRAGHTPESSDSDGGFRCVRSPGRE